MCDQSMSTSTARTGRVTVVCDRPAQGARRIAEDITVIIPTIGRKTLMGCLQSIVQGTTLPACIITVDQGNNPAVADWMRQLRDLGLNALHIHSMDRSPASARNAGIAKVSTRFVAAIDDDCEVEIKWLHAMQALLRQNPSAIVTGRLEAAGDGVPPTVVTSRVPRTYLRPSVRILSPLASANMGFAVSTANGIGAFDETLFSAEENDWAYRALKKGIPIVYAPELTVYHRHWRNASELGSTYQDYARCQGAFYGKHLRQGDWSMLLRVLISLFRGVRMAAIGIAKNNRTLCANGWTRIAYLMPGLLAGLRRTSQPT